MTNRRVLTLLVLGSLVGTAHAADLSPTLWKYASGQASSRPFLNQTAGDGTVFRGWANPAGLDAQALVFIHRSKLGPSHWMVGLMAPRAKLQDYVGTSKLKVFRASVNTGRLKNAVTYTIEGGMFKELFAAEGQTEMDGQSVRVVYLFTPEMVDSMAEFSVPTKVP